MQRTTPSVNRVRLGRLASEELPTLGQAGAPRRREPLQALLQAARAAWPGVRLDDRTFARYLAERIDPSAPAEAVLRDLSVSDLFLACACSQGDATALSLLETRYLAQLPRSLARVNASAAFADEVLQLLRRKLFSPGAGKSPRILAYAGRGPLIGWLRAAALRTALSLREANWREKGLDSAIEADLIASAADPEQALAKGQLRAHLKKALREAFDSLSAEERNLIRLHLVEGLSIDRLAVMFQIHRSTAARRIGRIRELLLEETRGHLAERAGLRDSDLDSALRLFQSGMDVSLSFLRP